MTQPINLAICIPARDHVDAGFAHDLATMSAHWYGAAPIGSKFNIHMVSGTLIADQRQKLVKIALKEGADWILFLDSDMRFPKNIAHRMIANDLDIVAANYATRRMPTKTVAFSNFEKLECIYLGDAQSRMQEVDAVGMGVMLVKAQVFKALPQPWFQIGYAPKSEAFVGEDIYFCKLAQRYGFKVMIDNAVSAEVRHIGVFEFSHEHAEAERDMDRMVTAEVEGAAA